MSWHHDYRYCSKGVYLDNSVILSLNEMGKTGCQYRAGNRVDYLLNIRLSCCEKCPEDRCQGWIRKIRKIRNICSEIVSSIRLRSLYHSGFASCVNRSYRYTLHNYTYLFTYVGQRYTPSLWQHDNLWKVTNRECVVQISFFHACLSHNRMHVTLLKVGLQQSHPPFAASL